MHKNKTNVLIVEDSKTCRTLIEYVMEKIQKPEDTETSSNFFSFNTSVRSIDQVVDPAALFHGTRPDLIVADYLLKGSSLDGDELIKYARGELNYNGPIILQTASAMSNKLPLFFDSGADLVVHKPYHPSTLAYFARRLLITGADRTSAMNKMIKLTREVAMALYREKESKSELHFLSEGAYLGEQLSKSSHESYAFLTSATRDQALSHIMTHSHTLGLRLDYYPHDIWSSKRSEAHLCKTLEKYDPLAITLHGTEATVLLYTDVDPHIFRTHTCRANTDRLPHVSFANRSFDVFRIGQVMDKK